MHKRQGSYLLSLYLNTQLNRSLLTTMTELALNRFAVPIGILAEQVIDLDLSSCSDSEIRKLIRMGGKQEGTVTSLLTVF